VDFAMNEACAAGTGSFLEERAEELGISIKGEFADLALSSKAPIKLGERCTVFMQQDVLSYQQRGAKKEDLTAGLAYSVAYNYLNRVVRGRKIGDVVFFQGGTAYNRAIASAFAEILGKEIIVPPYNGVMGAVGSALLAREKCAGTDAPSKFRGYSLADVDYSLKEFTCKACSNFCNMQEFTVEGEKTYWGDQCSDKFRRKQASDRQPVIDDLLAFRRDLLFRGYDPEAAGGATIGLPRGMYVHELFPFWNTLFRELGFRVVLSDETNLHIVRQGVEASIAEPCLPIQAYHGHVKNLLEKGVDWVFIPNLINAATPFADLNSFYCLWGQTLPFVVRESAAFAGDRDKILAPLLRFREGPESVGRSLYQGLAPLGVRRRAVRRALDLAYEAQAQFQQALLSAGSRALQALQEAGEIGIVLVGRTYNIHDRGMILDIGSKLRDYYGVNVIPMDFLPVDDVDISDVNPNMFWNYGRKIIAAAKIVADYPDLHIIYMTNFKCGPDSYIKHFITKASGKPFLVLQFDGHGNDAGYLTRCEAYLDSKGVLRWWARTA
ncbi:MAG: acyl-CoA dehydratase activase-related protein, partial [Gemmatimonadota bacterium]